MAVQIGGHVLLVEFHQYLYHLIDSLPDYEVPHYEPHKKGSLSRNLACEDIYVRIEKFDGSIAEYNQIKFPKVFGKVLDFYLYETQAVFFPCYEYFTLSKRGVVVRHALFQTGTSDPHTVFFSEVMLCSEMSRIKQIKWSGSTFSHTVDFVEVISKRIDRSIAFTRDSKKQAIITPHSVDLKQLCSPIFDQGDLGTCGISAITSLLEFVSGHKLSRLYLYYVTRVLFNGLSPEDDAGVELKDCMEALTKFGICREETWPYIAQNFLERPSAKSFTEAKHFRIEQSDFKPIHTMEQMKQTLRQGLPFFLDVNLTAESYGNDALRTGYLDKPPSLIDMCSHSLLIVGYNDEECIFHVQNSWGQWGLKGFGVLPYEYISLGHFSGAHSWARDKTIVNFSEDF